jgi:host factor-I protein
MTEMKFLEELRREWVPVTVFLMNGFQLHCVITGFDTAMVWVRDGSMEKAIYKHAISTIVPEREV